MGSSKWKIVRDSDKQKFRLNGYRLLLIRGRAGAVILAPKGERFDPTRSPEEMDEIASTLIAAGCVEI